jgi:hypothetical protein
MGEMITKFVKLSTREEILARVEEADFDTWILHDPVVIVQEAGHITFADFLAFTDQKNFVVDRKYVVWSLPVSKDLREYYEKHLSTYRQLYFSYNEIIKHSVETMDKIAEKIRIAKEAELTGGEAPVNFTNEFAHKDTKIKPPKNKMN